MKSKFLLLAEDDVDDVDIFTSLLAEIPLPIQIQVVSNGAELMRFLYSEKTLPDLIFLDLNMPLKNGMDCLAEIKSDPKLKSIPVIILSTASNSKQVTTAYNIGADLFLTKDVNYNNFKKIIDSVVQKDWEH